MNRLDVAWIRERLARFCFTAIDTKTVPKRAAVAIIFRELPNPQDCELLFIRRADNEHDPWSGHMAFPGGRMEAEDPSLIYAARRETLEEVSVDLEHDAEVLGRLDDTWASARGRTISLAISPYIFLLHQPVAPRSNEEVEQILWIPVSRLLDPRSAATVPYELKEQRYELPCFRIFDRVIWGITYRIIRQLFNVLQWEVGR